jgi:hypothetical protein
VILKDIEYRKLARANILNLLKNMFGNQEIFALHPNASDYLVSNKGKIKSLKSNKILKQYKNSNGYLVTNVILDNKVRKSIVVHRFIAETFIGFLGMNNYVYETNHIDGNKLNNNLENLEWLTRDENLDHYKQTRRQKNE